jgi:hypothetical protein
MWPLLIVNKGMFCCFMHRRRHAGAACGGMEHDAGRCAQLGCHVATSNSEQWLESAAASKFVCVCHQLAADTLSAFWVSTEHIGDCLNMVHCSVFAAAAAFSVCFQRREGDWYPAGLPGSDMQGFVDCLNLTEYSLLLLLLLLSLFVFSAVRMTGTLSASGVAWNSMVIVSTWWVVLPLLLLLPLLSLLLFSAARVSGTLLTCLAQTCRALFTF